MKSSLLITAISALASGTSSNLKHGWHGKRTLSEKECSDFSTQCEVYLWSNDAACTNSYQWMSENCQKTCGLCQFKNKGFGIITGEPIDSDLGQITIPKLNIRERPQLILARTNPDHNAGHQSRSESLLLQPITLNLRQHSRNRDPKPRSKNHNNVGDKLSDHRPVIKQNNDVSRHTSKTSRIIVKSTEHSGSREKYPNPDSKPKSEEFISKSEEIVNKPGFKSRKTKVRTKSPDGKAEVTIFSGGESYTYENSESGEKLRHFDPSETADPLPDPKPPVPGPIAPPPPSKPYKLPPIHVSYGEDAVEIPPALIEIETVSETIDPTETIDSAEREPDVPIEKSSETLANEAKAEVSELLANLPIPPEPDFAFLTDDLEQIQHVLSDINVASVDGKDDAVQYLQGDSLEDAGSGYNQDSRPSVRRRQPQLSRKFSKTLQKKMKVSEPSITTNVSDQFTEWSAWSGCIRGRQYRTRYCHDYVPCLPIDTLGHRLCRFSR